MADETHDPTQLASDGDAVLAGVTPPTAEELVAAAARSTAEVEVHIEAHLAEVDAWRAGQQ